MNARIKHWLRNTNKSSIQDYDYLAILFSQSNVVGNATNPATVGLTGVIPFAKIYNPTSGLYESLQFPNNNQGASNLKFGPELSLGKYLGNALQKNIYLAKYAVDGAGLAVTNDRNDFNPAAPATTYNGLKARVLAAK